MRRWEYNPTGILRWLLFTNKTRSYPWGCFEFSDYIKKYSITICIGKNIINLSVIFIFHFSIINVKTKINSYEKIEKNFNEQRALKMNDFMKFGTQNSWMVNMQK